MSDAEIVGLSETLARNLKEARRNAPGRPTQEELARRCGIHRAEISVLERGKGEPRLRMLVKLSSSLGISIDELTEDIIFTPLGDQPENSRLSKP